MNLHLELTTTDVFRLEQLLDKICNEPSLDDIDWGVILTLEKVLKTAHDLMDIEERIKFLNENKQEVRCTCGHSPHWHALAGRTGLCVLENCLCEKFNPKG